MAHVIFLPTFLFVHQFVIVRNKSGLRRDLYLHRHRTLVFLILTLTPFFSSNCAPDMNDLSKQVFICLFIFFF